jgi:hypothetical protein
MNYSRASGRCARGNIRRQRSRTARARTSGSTGTLTWWARRCGSTPSIKRSCGSSPTRNTPVHRLSVEVLAYTLFPPASDPPDAAQPTMAGRRTPRQRNAVNHRILHRLLVRVYGAVECARTSVFAIRIAPPTAGALDLNHPSPRPRASSEVQRPRRSARRTERYPQYLTGYGEHRARRAVHWRKRQLACVDISRRSVSVLQQATPPM